jgi:UDP-4-amino-4,6-dideoxy-N-acetyl-beta-L-altrosamine transaminase
MHIQYGRQSISDRDVAAVTETLKSNWLTIGPEVEKFENRISNITESKYSVAVSSGTAALHCAYKALDIGPGDEVITTPLTFVATASTAIQLGATVVFADVAEDTGNIDPKSVANLITDRTKVIAGVDFAGHPIDINELSDLAHSVGAKLLEDAAHSIGSLYKGEPVGAISDITAFSFFPTKNLTTGEGGAVATNDPTLYSKAKKFKMHGLIREVENMKYPNEGPWHQEVHEFGLNYRLPDILCALGSSQLDRLQQFKSNRTRIFRKYVDSLNDLEWLTLPTWRPYVDPMWHLFPIRVPNESRRNLVEHLRDNGIIAQVNYIPVYWHPVFEDMGYQRGLCPVAENYYKGEISIPMYSDLTDSDQDYVIEVLRNYGKTFQ